MLNKVANNQDFAKITGGLEKGELESVEYGILNMIVNILGFTSWIRLSFKINIFFILLHLSNMVGLWRLAIFDL